MKTKFDHDHRVVFYVLTGLFVVIVLYLTVMMLNLLNSSELKGAPTSIPEISSTIPQVTD